MVLQTVFNLDDMAVLALPIWMKPRMNEKNKGQNQRMIWRAAKFGIQNIMFQELKHGKQ